MATFHLLPLELRTQIWELALQPRIVEVRGKYLRYWEDTTGPDDLVTSGYSAWKHVTVSSTPPPAILHVCHESRDYAIKKSWYQRAFTSNIPEERADSDALDPGGSSAQDRRAKKRSSRQRACSLSDFQGSYIWVSFDLDLISIKPQPSDLNHIVFDEVESEKARIQRLRFQGALDEGFFDLRSGELHRFPNLREVQVMALPDWRDWEQVVEPRDVWLCVEDENLWLIDQRTGFMVNGHQFREIVNWWWHDPHLRGPMYWGVDSPQSSPDISQVHEVE